MQRLGQKPSYTWNDAVVRWVKEKEGKASLNRDIIEFRYLHPFFDGLVLRDITRDQIQAIGQRKLDSGCTPATANRTLQLIRGVLKRSERIWEWIDKAPAVSLYPEPKGRVRWLTKAEANRLLAELPDHLRDMAEFTLATGLRDKNVTQLQWHQVDMTKRLATVAAEDVKNRKALGVPLNDRAMRVLERRRGIDFQHVFTFKGKPVLRANNTAWRKALKRARITDFTWHDLRHTWASWHIQNGTPLHVLQQLGGWSSPEMVKRYAHLSSDHLMDYAQQMDGSTTPAPDPDKPRAEYEKQLKKA